MLKRPDDDGGAVSKAGSMRLPGASRGNGKDATPESLANGRFTIEKRLGQGSFGTVLRGYDTKAGKRVAIKLEHKKSSGAGQLGNESRLMEELGRPDRHPGFTEVLYFGREGSYSILAMDLLGPSLEDTVQICGGTVDAHTAAMAAEQGIHLLAFLHSKSIVHRDIKAENFMWGIEDKCHHLYLIDFGMSTKYRLKRHVSMATNKQMTGTARYASINAMKGCTQSRRDDLEALAHVLIYALRGSLPWSGLDARTYKEKLMLITKTKEKTPLEELCQGFPEQFMRFLHYSRNLQFEEIPKYDVLTAGFRELRTKEDHDLQFLQGLKIDPSTLAPLEHLGQPCAQAPEDAPQSIRVESKTSV